MTPLDHTSRDAGFSIVELAVAMTVGALVLAVIYSILTSALQGFEVVNAGTRELRATADTLDFSSRLIRETEDLVHAEDYAIEFTADYDDDKVLEYMRFEAKSDGTIVETARDTAGGPVTFRRVLADNVWNVSRGVPMFTYHDVNGAVAPPDTTFTPPKDGDRLTKTALVKIKVIARDPDRASDWVQTTDVALRNPQS